MSMSLAVHETQTTNSSSSFGYLKNNVILSFDCEPQVETCHNVSSCPLCWFRETPSVSIKEHLSSKKHQRKWVETCDKSQCSSDDSVLFLEAKERRPLVLKKKKDILRQCGLIPSYIRVLWRRDFNILFFYEIPKVRKARIANGETHLLERGAQFYACKYAYRKSLDMCFVTAQPKTKMPMYVPFESIDKFQKFYRTVPKTKKWFRELILDGKPTREIYDLETTEFAKGEVSEEHVFDLFCKARKDFGIEQKLKFIPLKSSGESKGKYKLSLRIFVKRMHKDIHHLKCFVQMFRDWLQEREKEYSLLLKMLDFGIYTKNRQIRIIGSTKYGEDRYFEEFDDWKGEVAFKNFFCTGHVSDWVDIGPKPQVQKKVKERKERSIVVSGERLGPIRFLLSGLSDKRRSEYADWTLVAFFIFGITRNVELGTEILREFSESSENYDETRFEDWIRGNAQSASMFTNPVPLSKMRWWFREDNMETPSLLQELDEQLEKIGYEKPEIKTLEKELFLPRADEKIDVSEFDYTSVPLGKDALAIQSNLGTGKTKFVSRLLTQDGGTQLIISYRKSLNRELKLKNFGFSLYSEFLDYKIRGCKKLVCSIDSIARVSGHYSTIVIDEFSETINQMMSVCRDPLECFEILRELVRNAESVVVLDAFLTESSVQLLRDFGRKVQVVVNEHKAHSEKSCTILSSFEELCVAAKRSLESGENIVVPMTSEKKLQVFCDMLEEELDLENKVLRYTAETMNGDSVDTSTWKNYRVIAYTSCITAGVSFEEEHFDRVFFYFTSLSCNVVDSVQMLFRVRNISSQNFVGVVNSRQANVPCTIESLKRHIEAQLLSGKRCLRLHSKKVAEKVAVPRGIKTQVLSEELEENKFTSLYLQNLLRNNLSKRWFQEQLFAYLGHQGVSVSEESLFCEEKELLCAHEEIKGLADCREKDECSQVLSSEIISGIRHKEIVSRGYANVEEKRSCQRYTLCNAFRVPPERLTFDFIWNNKKYALQFKNRCIASGEREVVRKRLRRLLRERIKDDKYRSLSQKVLESERQKIQKVYLAWEMIDSLGFSDFDLKRKVRHVEFMARIDKEIERVKKDETLYTTQFFGIFKSRVAWINKILGDVFGVGFGKTSPGKRGTWFLKSKFKTREKDQEFDDEGNYIPLPEWIERFVPVCVSFEDEDFEQ